MRCHEIPIDAGKNEWNHLTVLSDLHLDSPDSDVDSLQRLIRDRKKLGPRHRFILLGDNNDAIVPTDYKRYRPSGARPKLVSRDDYINAMVDYTLDILREARPLEMVVTGNHESQLMARYHVDPISMFCSQHPDRPRAGGMCGFLRYKMRFGGGDANAGGYNLTLLYHHGAWFGMARIPPGAVRWAHEAAEGWDIFCYGHNHRYGATCDAKMRMPARGCLDEAVARDVYIVSCGTHLRNYQTHDAPGYGEVRGHSVTKIGAPLISWRRATTIRREIERVNLDHNRPEIKIET